VCGGGGENEMATIATINPGRSTSRRDSKPVRSEKATKHNAAKREAENTQRKRTSDGGQMRRESISSRFEVG